ncbi:MAG: putative lipid II flippase FtsW [Alphaproteobacteria bacterium]|nr:putative lipid II flippase FtsW [Alphaproteobacteria bacterium]
MSIPASVIPRSDTSLVGRWWWTVDRWLLMAILVIVAFGALMTLAASPSVAERIGLDGFHFARRHAIMLIPALALMFIISLMDVRTVRRLAVLGFFLSLVAMAAVLVIGSEIKGAKRWIDLGVISLQPSEFLKPTFAVFTAWMFSLWRTERDFPGHHLATAFFALALLLLLAQPDIGQAFVLTAIFGAQYFLAGLPLAIVVALILLGIAGMVGAYFTFDHVASRIDRFLDPQSGDSYQVDRSLEAFANGGLLGTGPGEGVVKNRIPDVHADFVFAVAGEELGALVCLVVVALFAFVVLRGMARLMAERDLFVLIAGTGLFLQFGLQTLVNLGSTLRMLPTKGMTLPFVSYGGSSLLAVALTMGIALALTRKRQGTGGTA